MSNHETKNTAAEHMKSFYKPFSEIFDSGKKFDGLIITGAPIEHLDYEEVTYWKEIVEIFNWTSNARSFNFWCLLGWHGDVETFL